MGIFSSAPVYSAKPPPQAKKKAPRWNIHAQRAKLRNQLQATVTENARLREENRQLKLVNQRLQLENDGMWQYFDVSAREKKGREELLTAA